MLPKWCIDDICNEVRYVWWKYDFLFIFIKYNWLPLIILNTLGFILQRSADKHSATCIYSSHQFLVECDQGQKLCYENVTILLQTE